MAIYFDANLLRDGLTSLWAAAVRAVGRAHKLEIAVPQLVLDEVRSNRQRLIEQRAAQIETAIAFGSGLFKVPIFDRPHPGRLAAEWVHEIQKMVRLIPASDQHAAEALRRELERVPPARESAGRGMGARDCAIWLAIAEDHRSRSEDGYLLSADGAFRDPGSKEPRLHPVLAAERSATERGKRLEMVTTTTMPLIQHLAGK